MSDLVEQPDVISQRGPSELLVASRQRLGFSQKEVADKLYLATEIIKYIDDGDFDGIRKPAFVKGYLRSYARIVDLKGDDIVSLYEAEIQAVEPTPTIRGVTEESVGSASITGPVLQTGLIGLVGLALIIGLIWWLVSDSETPRVAQVTSPAPKYIEPEPFDYVISSENAALGVNKRIEADVGKSLETALVTGVDQGINAASIELAEMDELKDGEPSIRELEAAFRDENPVIDGAVADQSSIIFERTTDGERSYITVNAEGFDQLELSFAEECWVEITDGRFGPIYNDLNRADDVLTIYGTSPFQILLGKATSVEMIYNGRPFDLEPFISADQTAKLTVTD